LAVVVSRDNRAAQTSALRAELLAQPQTAPAPAGAPAQSDGGATRSPGRQVGLGQTDPTKLNPAKPVPAPTKPKPAVPEN